MFLLFLWGSPCAQDDITWRLLIIMLIVTVVVTVLDYVVPGWLTRVTGGTKYASRGATAGMIVGILFFPPWGMGSFLGFLLGTGAKLAASGVMLYYIIIALIP